MSIISQPGFNVDNLEGAILHMVQTCGCLTDASLNEYAVKFAFARGKKLAPDYASGKLLPRLIKQRKIWRTGEHFYSINPLVKFSRDSQDAFWVYLESMEDIEPNLTMSGPFPAQISYIKNGCVYHIVRATKSGDSELAYAVQLEIATEQRRRKHGNDDGKANKFIFIFSSQELADAAKYTLKSQCLFCVITYPTGELIPELEFQKQN